MALMTDDTPDQSFVIPRQRGRAMALARQLGKLEKDGVPASDALLAECIKVCNEVMGCEEDRTRVRAAELALRIREAATRRGLSVLDLDQKAHQFTQSQAQAARLHAAGQRITHEVRSYMLVVDATTGAERPAIPADIIAAAEGAVVPAQVALPPSPSGQEPSP